VILRSFWLSFGEKWRSLKKMQEAGTYTSNLPLPVICGPILTDFL
jgi:hypothetical protein